MQAETDEVSDWLQCHINSIGPRSSSGGFKGGGSTVFFIIIIITVTESGGFSLFCAGASPYKIWQTWAYFLRSLIFNADLHCEIFAFILSRSVCILPGQFKGDACCAYTTLAHTVVIYSRYRVKDNFMKCLNLQLLMNGMPMRYTHNTAKSVLYSVGSQVSRNYNLPIEYSKILHKQQKCSMSTDAPQNGQQSLVG